MEHARIRAPHKLLLLLALTIFAFLQTGCAPGLGTTFPLGRVETVSVEEKVLRNVSGLRVRWGAVTDQRDTAMVAEINGRELEGDRTPEQAARRIIEAQFREAGVKPSLFEGPEVTCDVREWKVSITPGFPATKIEARAEVRLAVLPDSRNANENTPQAPLYAARYSGEVTEEHPIGSTDRIEKVFAQAMAEAAASALGDERLVEELRARSVL